ncbi:MAG: hypothetical protein ABL932_10335, partial [Terricaulis sp.]
TQPTRAGLRLIEKSIPPELGVEGSERARLIVRSYLTGLPVNSTTRALLKAGKVTRALFVSNKLFKLEVPPAKGQASTVARCSEYVGCEWARRQLKGVLLPELLLGANARLKRRLFCVASGIDEFDSDAGFRKLITSELSLGSTSLNQPDSDWALFRAMRSMRLARDPKRDRDNYPVIASAISAVTSKSLSKWALVSDVFRAAPQGSFRDLVTFKQSLIDLVEQGSLELSPVVVQASVAANDREMSELSFGGRQFHFVRIRHS